MDFCTWMCRLWSISKDLHQIFVDRGCYQKDRPEVMDDKDIWLVSGIQGLLDNDGDVYRGKCLNIRIKHISTN